MGEPVTGERGTILELPYNNPEGHATVELTTLVGARVVGEHRHPSIVERFTVLEDELTLKREGQTSILRAGTGGDHPRRALCAHDRDPVRARTPRIYQRKRMPHPLQLALFAREFSDVLGLRRLPAAVQRVNFATLAPIARRRGYRATYPQLSRAVLAPRTYDQLDDFARLADVPARQRRLFGRRER